ncbi:MAG: hemolysin family protein [Treponema sp.]|nr:hemolysin family protein [Treponema sp.]
MNRLYLAGLLSLSVILLLLSTLFSISESSFLGINKLRLRILKNKKDKRAVRAGKLLEKKELLINTLLVANDLVNILLSSIITALAIRFFGEKGVGLATFVVTVFLLIFGEITPKTLSTRNPDAIAYRLSLFVSILVKLLRPIVFIFTSVSRIALRIKGIKVEKNKESYTQEDIRSFIDAGAETGILEKGEDTMMTRVFKFSDLEAQSIMIPRTAIIALKDTSTYGQVLEIAQRTRFSYFPVYGENIDDIKGILYLKDLLKYSVDNFNIQAVMRPPLFIPGTKKISSVHHVFRERNESMAIVIDEYSGTDGVITKEDIVRQIFGKRPSSTPWRNQASLSEIENKTSFTLDGTTLLKDLKELLGVELVSDINETLGGWITERLGRLAMPYDSVTFQNIVFTVEDINKRRIKTVRVERRAQIATEEARGDL